MKDLLKSILLWETATDYPGCHPTSPERLVRHFRVKNALKFQFKEWP